MYRSSRHRLSGAHFVLLAFIVVACAPDETPTEPGFVDPRTPTTGAPSAGRLRVEGFRDRGEIRSGWVVGRDGQPMRITFEIHSGRAIWQGDIDLGPATEISATSGGAKPYLRQDEGHAARVGGPVQGVIPDDVNFRWPGGVVPYVVDPALPSQDRITQAIDMIESTTGGVTIVPRTNQADYVKFVPDADGCSSEIGRRGGEQVIKLTSDCGAGSTAHELLHALGITHEQNRCDRDTYVEIQFDHIPDDKRHNFEIACDGWTDIASYDFGSVLHYPLDAFSSDGQPTIKLRPGITYDGVIGQRDALGVADEITVNHMYGLNNQAPVAKICTLAGPYLEGTSLQLDGTCSTDADDKVLSYDWNFGDGICAGDDGPQCVLAKPPHTYAQDGVYKLGLTVWDHYALGSTEAFITIQNVAPTFTLNPFLSINEGGSIFRFVNFTDPGADIWTSTVNFGDGTTPSTLDTGGKNVSFSHAYADNSPPGTPFQVSLSIRDDDVTTTVTEPLTVRNVAPNVNAGSDVTVESGQSFNFSGSFSDPGLLDSPWQWSINWGVGSPTTGSTTTQSAITASRQLCAAGNYTVTLSVTDKDGGVGTDALQVTVGFVTVGTDIMPGGTPNAVSLKKKGSLPVAILSSATFDATTIDVSSARLGDGTGTETPAETQKGRYVTRAEDVNKDGLLDLVVSFSVQELITNGDLTESSTSLVIGGFQGAGGGSCVNFRGTDAVVIVQ